MLQEIKQGAKILSIKEVAELLVVHERTIYHLVKEGKIPGFKLGGQWRFDEATIRQWVNREMLKNCVAPQ